MGSLRISALTARFVFFRTAATRVCRWDPLSFRSRFGVVDGVGSYAVVWEESDGRPITGQLMPREDSMLLEGVRDGRLVRLEIFYRDLGGIRVGRDGGERLNDRPTLVVERNDAPRLLISALGAGMLHELVDVLTTLSSPAAAVEQIAVVLPLTPDGLDKARRYVSLGAPFDLAGVSLSRHEVYLSSREAIFVFYGDDACEAIRRLMQEPSVLRRMGGWHALLDGPPRLAEARFSWRRPG
jgi:hypothetical protein